MAAQESSNQATSTSGHKVNDARARIQKKNSNARKSSKPGLKRRDGLLSTRNRPRSELKQIAKRNSTESPLLRLPPEIRNMIWNYAVGNNEITIKYGAQFKFMSAPPIFEISSPHPGKLLGNDFIFPRFQLHKVCWQMYNEISGMIYADNTFSFDGQRTFDRWIKSRPLGQKRLITSVSVPFSYMLLYLRGSRKSFRKTFPNIKCISVDRSLADYYWWDKEGRESPELGVVNAVKSKEGKHVEVEWQ